jgi:Domain of unknown function (DUF4112)
LKSVFNGLFNTPPKPVPVEIPEPIRLAKHVAYWLDNAIELPFVKRRIGLDAIVGLIPGGGDTITALYTLWVVYLAYRYELPKPVIQTMVVNAAIDWAGGLVPIAGDLFDGLFKAHAKNSALLEEHYIKAYKDRELRQGGTIEVKAT